jgi:hypothetical protein
LKNLAEPAPIALPALGKPGSEHSSLFCCYRDRLSAIKIGFLAETLRRQRFGRSKTAKGFAVPSLFSAVLSPTQPFGKFLSALQLV